MTAAYRANELDAKLASSSFDSWDDLRRFVEWYKSMPHRTDWDNFRSNEAAELMRMRDAVENRQ